MSIKVVNTNKDNDIAMTLEELYITVPDEGDTHIEYIDYWKEADENLVEKYIKSHEIKTTCAKECINCQITHIEKYKELYPNSPKVSNDKYLASGEKGHLTHAWQIKCPLIPESYSTMIPAALRKSLSKDQVEDLLMTRDPVLFAKRNFLWEPRKHQELYLRCQSKNKVARWGRQCLKEGTLVMVPGGSKPIEQMKIGDFVYDHRGQLIRVLDVIDQGIQEVVDLVHENIVVASCTENHIWLAHDKKFFFNQEVKTEILSSNWAIERCGPGGKHEVAWTVEKVNKYEAHTWDLTVNSKESLYLLANGLVTHNSGKSAAMVMEILFHAFTNSKVITDPNTGLTIQEPYRILIVAPFENQVISIFESLILMLNRSDATKDSIEAYRKSPHHHLELKNKCIIKGFTTGSNDAESLRGQSADLIVIDEADYLSEGDFKTILPIANSKPNIQLRVASTPKGKRDRFWKWATSSPNWKEFYFPTAVIDKTPFAQSQMTWKQMKLEIRPNYSHDEWLQEVMAYFIANVQGVYQPGFVTSAIADYTYKEMNDMHNNGDLIGWKYSVGVDWNSNVGTEMCIMGWSPSIGFRIMDMVNVPKQEHTQYKGLKRLVDLFKLWKPDYVYVDAGHGAANIEALNIWAASQPPGSYENSLQHKIKKYEFGGKIEIRDPTTQMIVKHPGKAFLVENSVRKFEDGVIKFSREDEKLRKQLLNYIITNRTEGGKPIYGFENKSIGDHALDAMNLALVAYALEMGPMAKDGPVLTAIGILGNQQHRNTVNELGIVGGSRDSILTTIEHRQDSIGNRNDRIASSGPIGYSSNNIGHINTMKSIFDDKTPIQTTRPGFLSDTESDYKRSSMRTKNHIGRNGTGSVGSRTRGM